MAFEPEFTKKVAFLVELGFASREKIGGVSPREMLLATRAFLHPCRSEFIPTMFWSG